MTRRPHPRARGRLATAALGLLAAAVPACGDSGPETARVSGTITKGGEPIGGGTITFVSTDPGRRNATGTIAADGIYELMTFEPGDGAQPGDYQVAITGTTEEQILDYIPAEPVEVESEVPARYNDPSTSGLTASVESGRNTKNFELEQ